MDTQQYYAALRAQRETLAKQFPSGYLLAVSIDNPQKNSTPGNICEVTVVDAARLLLDGTHRIAAPAEVQAHQDRQGLERARNRRDDLDRVREQFERTMPRA